MKTRYWTKEQLEDYQLQQLKKISKVWNLGIKGWEDFYSLPVTSKKDIFDWKPSENMKYFTHETSGSTGEPRKIYVPKETWYRKMSIFRRSWTLIGRKDEPVLRIIAGKPKFGWYDYWRNVKPINYRNIVSEHLNYLIKKKPYLIHGPGGATRIFVEAIAKLGYYDILKNIRIMWLGQSSEGHKERLLELCKSFHESYGLAELPTVANPCMYSSHINMETGIIEFIKGEIVVTDFNNYVMPIIRYRTGDEGKMKESDCPCGMKHPILYDVKGRRSDYYYGPEVKKAIGWWVVSPISHNFLYLVKAWRADVYPKKGKFKLYVVFRDKEDFESLEWYRKWINEQTGLECEIIKRNDSTKWKRKLIRVIT